MCEFCTQHGEGQKWYLFGQVVPLEEAEMVIDLASSIMRMPCGCRYLNPGKENCRYCFGVALDRLGLLGVYPDSSASLEVMDKEEAKAVVRKFDQVGLFHSVWTGLTPYVTGLCNCDHDCGAYRGYLKKGGSASFFRGESVCQTDWDDCNGSKACLRQCQFGAMFYSSANKKVSIDPSRCFGCGLCRAACAREAITMIPRESDPQAKGLWLTK